MYFSGYKASKHIFIRISLKESKGNLFKVML